MTNQQEQRLRRSVGTLRSNHSLIDTELFPARGYADVMPASLSGRTAAVLTASDRCFAGTRADESGPGLKKLLQEEGAQVLEVVVSPDDLHVLIQHLRTLAAAQVQLIVTTGGTGLSARDNTPEATMAVCQRLIPGLAEYLRQTGLAETPFSVLSRGVCGIADRSLVINLPGSTRGAITGLRRLLPLLPHSLDLLSGHTDHVPSPVQSSGSA